MNNKLYYINLHDILSNNNISFQSIKFTEEEIESIESTFNLIDYYENIKSEAIKCTNSYKITDHINDINVMFNKIDVCNNSINHYHDKINNALNQYLK